MSRKIIVLGGFRDVKDTSLLARANVVLGAMENNDNFINCQEAVAQLSFCFDEFMAMMALGRNDLLPKKSIVRYTIKCILQSAA